MEKEKHLKTKAAPAPADDPLEFVMSDGTVDRMGDIIEPDGWRLDNFRRNPVALFKHDPGFLVGNWRDVGVRKGQLTGRLELMEPVSDRQREVHTAVRRVSCAPSASGFTATVSSRAMAAVCALPRPSLSSAAWFQCRQTRTRFRWRRRSDSPVRRSD